VVKQCKLPPRRLTSTESDQGFESDFQINLDSDPGDCRIAPKMLRIHYLVSISYFAELLTCLLLKDAFAYFS